MRQVSKTDGNLDIDNMRDKSNENYYGQGEHVYTCVCIGTRTLWNHITTSLRMCLKYLQLSFVHVLEKNRIFPDRSLECDKFAEIFIDNSMPGLIVFRCTFSIYLVLSNGF